MARGVDGRIVYIDDLDKHRFLNDLNGVLEAADADLLAYCLMGNHFHLALQVRECPLSFVMQRLLTKYSQAFNYRHGRTGHLFQARYRAALCMTPNYLYALVRYIHLNPVRAKLVETAQGWPWSSYRDYHAHGAARFTRLRVLPEITTDESSFDPWPRQTRNETPILFRIESTPAMPLQDIAVRFARAAGVDALLLRSKSRCRAHIALRREFTIEAVRSGHRPQAVAAWLGTSAMSVSRYLSGNTVNTVRPDP